VSLRTGVNQNFIVLDTGNSNKVLGEVDYNAAPFLLHDHAIYIHNAVTYYVENLEWDRRTAYVRQRNVDYYTDAEASTAIRVLSTDQELSAQNESSLLEARRFGDISVTTVIAKFKKVKFETHESIGYGEVSVPQLEIQTEAMWYTFRDDIRERMKKAGHDVAPALQGLAGLLRNTLPFAIMCDTRDIGVVSLLRSPHDQRPSIIVFDRFPGGIGLSRRHFANDRPVLEACLDIVRSCPCADGCPSCVGPVLEAGDGARAATRFLLEQLLGVTTGKA
jgi:DEAD/DEAH box helicase domain-containing protein